MRRRAAGLGMVGWLVLVLTLAPGPAVAQAGEAIRGYRVDITIESTGDLLITEVIGYDFGSGDRHGIFRDIPVRYRYDNRYDRIYRLMVESVTGSPETPTDYRIEDIGGGRKRIKIGDPDRSISGAHTYHITYRVRGAMNGFPDHDELYWNAIGADWDVPISEPRVTVRTRGRITNVACFAGPLGSSLPCARADAIDRTAQFSTPTLGAHEALTVVVGLPVGVVPTPRPILDERWTLDRAFARTPATIGGSAGLLAVIIAGVAYLVWRGGRDRRYVGSPIDIALGSDSGVEETLPLLADRSVPVEFVPPDELRPGQVGTLVDEIAHPLDVTATIVDLAVRGYLRIEEIPKEGWFGTPDWFLVQLRAGGDDLRRYERLLFDALFEGGRSAAKLSELRNTFASHLHAVQRALYDDVVELGWFSRRPDRVRLHWRLLGGLAVAVAVALSIALAAFTHAGLVGVAIVIGALALFVAAKWMPRRTAKGTGVRMRTLGFRRFIEESEKERAQFAERQNLFSEYLPYAIVFGATEKWANAFAGLERELPEMSWYTGAHPLTIVSFSEAIDGFTTTTAGTIASTPGGSGDSGFSGGGFSGGGGGGGGGGSW